jgi:hypothetical protein
MVVEGMNPGDIEQGCLGDCWLLGALSCLATRVDLLQNLITFDGMQYGFVVVQFFKNGEWKPVVVDTRLPCNPKTKKLIYAHCMSENEFWVCFLEKGYAKLFGNYEELNGGKMPDSLVDLTGGVTEKINLKEFLGDAQQHAQQQAAKAAELWRMVKANYQSGYVMGCSLNDKNSKVEASPEGIVYNHAYGILSVREIQGLKLIRVRNPWGKGEWRGAFSDDDDNWDNYKGLREAVGVELKDDGIFWMEFKDWYMNYTKLYVGKIFPSNWQQYSIACAWKGKTNGGRIIFQHINYFIAPEMLSRSDESRIDSDDKWFNNPQIRFSVKTSVKTFIVSLMQADAKISKMAYAPCSFYVFKTKAKHDRLWEPIKEDVVDCPHEEGEDVLPQREVMKQLKIEMEEKKKEQNYIIVPHIVDKDLDGRPFWLRIFSSDPIEVCLLPETIELEERGMWNKDLTLGPRLIDNTMENPNWCENPQFFLNLNAPTHVKIVLRRTIRKKAYGANIGILIAKSESDKSSQYTTDKYTKIQKQKVQMKAIRDAMNQRKIKKQVVSFVQIDKPKINKKSRKLRIGPKEWFVETQYVNPTVAAYYCHWHQTAGPFIIVPSLSKPVNKEVFTGPFSLTSNLSLVIHW